MLRRSTAGARVQEQPEIDHRHDLAAIAKQSGQKRRGVRDRAELDPGHQLDDPCDIDGVAICTGFEESGAAWFICQDVSRTQEHGAPAVQRERARSCPA